jgi:hypothetical protein
MKGGVGEGRETGTGSPKFDSTSIGLAQEWVFYLTRKRNGIPADSVDDMTHEFHELIRHGNDPEKLSAAVREETRDRGEFFWQFKDRFMGRKGKNGTKPNHRYDAKRDG